MSHSWQFFEWQSWHPIGSWALMNVGVWGAWPHGQAHWNLLTNTSHRPQSFQAWLSLHILLAVCISQFRTTGLLSLLFSSAAAQLPWALRGPHQLPARRVWEGMPSYLMTARSVFGTALVTLSALTGLRSSLLWSDTVTLERLASTRGLHTQWPSSVFCFLKDHSFIFPLLFHES